ncbi:MAG: ABC transporter ATP-binding protein [Candidatus Poribacteria bacterium]|nr:ABC transporter ATP-binding protein [Candidatus Poribacteria bacterium]MEE2618853.1 ABC transporter ATP-binding protein [Candidatus Poribacteria bacterium]
MLDYPLLDIAGLSTIFNTDDGAIRAVDDVSFSINRGQTLGIVGESGCGKSVTGLSILQLQSPGHIEKGQIHYYKSNKDLPIDITQLAPKSEEMRSIRGNDIAMIFQEPMTSLNPVYTIGNQISEAVVLHQQVSKKEARSRSIEMLERVGIPAPHKRVDDYPHQFSGGMRQRAMIAMALSCNPSLLIADEPTTALDVTIQAQVLDLMRELQEELGMAIMMITHDLGVIAEITNEIVIMYAGRVVEKGNLDQIFYHPLHPYTRGLLASIPVLGADSHKQLHSISGSVPRPSAMPPGCAFAPRCAERFERCDEMPELKAVGEHNSVRCWLHESN